MELPAVCANLRSGMWYCTRSQWFLATLCFGAACSFRANGVLLFVHLVWGLAGEPLVARERVCRFALLAAHPEIVPH